MFAPFDPPEPAKQPFLFAGVLASAAALVVLFGSGALVEMLKDLEWADPGRDLESTLSVVRQVLSVVTLVLVFSWSGRRVMHRLGRYESWPSTLATSCAAVVLAAVAGFVAYLVVFFTVVWFLSFLGIFVGLGAAAITFVLVLSPARCMICNFSATSPSP